MKENFDRAFDLLMRIEGVYSDDPDDRGGKTLYGITEKNFPNEFYEISQIKTPEYRLAYAKDFYKKEFWDKAGCDDLVDGLDIAVFDFGVNSGIDRAMRLLKVTQDWKDYLFNRIDFVVGISKGSQLKFLRGWINRCLKVWRALK
ncbi:MAG: glycosyl hydrolase 108 family protein [Dehalococcoidales bacterium]|nr:glycosyl hydrolase 108 family protein [Dehalococcoidales bacterium]